MLYNNSPYFSVFLCDLSVNFTQILKLPMQSTSIGLHAVENRILEALVSEQTDDRINAVKRTI